MAADDSADVRSEAAACVDVVLALYEAIDGKHASEAIDLFTTDAEFGHPIRTVSGLEEIRAFLTENENDKARNTLHMLHNTRVKDVAAAERDVCSVVVVKGLTEEQSWETRAVARMRHRVRFQDGRWLIAARFIEPLERVGPRCDTHQVGW